MLFDKKTEPCCAYCKKGARMDNEQVICEKYGIVSSGGSCRHFRYDPLKRCPARPVILDTEQYSKEDFEL